MIRFYKIVEGGFAPRFASKSANGTLPTNGYRYCEPLRTASAFGWLVYLPMEFWLIWDGAEVRWSIDGGATWYPLAGGIQYPGAVARFDAAAPPEVKGYSTPFILRGVDHNVFQIWTGCLVRTDPGYASLIRAPVNQFWRSDYQVMEGVIETDSWFGPLFTNIVLRKTDTPIIFRTTQPFLQVQPIPIAHLAAAAQPDSAELVEGLDGFTAEDWAAYERTVVHRVKNRQRLGEYAVDVRRRAASAQRKTGTPQREGADLRETDPRQPDE